MAGELLEAAVELADEHGQDKVTLKHPWLHERTEEGTQDTFDADRAFQEGLRPILAGLTGL